MKGSASTDNKYKPPIMGIALVIALVVVIVTMTYSGIFDRDIEGFPIQKETYSNMDGLIEVKDDNDIEWKCHDYSLTYPTSEFDAEYIECPDNLNKCYKKMKVINETARIKLNYDDGRRYGNRWTRNEIVNKTEDKSLRNLTYELVKEDCRLWIAKYHNSTETEIMFMCGISKIDKCGIEPEDNWRNWSSCVNQYATCTQNARAVQDIYYLEFVDKLFK